MDNSDIQILVVDDDPDILFATVRILKKEGFEVINAYTGNQSLEKVENNHPDLILLDVELPDIQGTEVCEKVKGNPDHQKKYIMMLSAVKISSDNQADGLDCGADCYVIRPVSNRELVARVKVMVRLIRAERKSDSYILEIEQAIEKIKVLSDMQSHLIKQLQEKQAKREESQDKFEKISSAAQDAIICMDSDGKISFWNKAAEKIFNYTQEEVLGKNLHNLIVPDRFLGAHLRAFPTFGETGQGAAIGKTLELSAVRRDGSEIPIELSLAGTRISGKWNGIGVLRDISVRKKAQQEIEQALNVHRVLDTILNISLPPLMLQEVLLKSLDAILSIPVFSLLDKGAIFVASEDEQILKMEAHRNLPDPLLKSCNSLPFGGCLCGQAAITHEIVFTSELNDQHDIKYRDMEPHGHYCVPILSEGRILGVLIAYVQAGHVDDESEKTFLKTVADTLAVVIERKRNEEKFKQLAHYDKLTGLPNRVLLYDRMEQTLALAVRNRQEFPVLFLDLDHFKKINDTLGHDMGDVLLVETASRLLACVRSTDTVARMGGDEFIVIITEVKTLESVENVATKIIKALREPFELKGKYYNIGCSVGIALFPSHGIDSENLIKAADVAMYQAKTQRNTFCFFSPAS